MNAKEYLKKLGITDMLMDSKSNKNIYASDLLESYYIDRREKNRYLH